MNESTTQRIFCNRTVTPRGVRPCLVEVSDGRIATVDVEPSRDRRRGVMDLGDLVLMPGIVDTHVHVNEPGRTEWEGFESATRAAAAGGVTTVVDMPLNSIPATTTVAAWTKKTAAAAGATHVDVGFWGGVVPGNASELEPLAAAGVLGFKCFLVDSGVAEFPAVNERDLRDALPILARLELPLLVHAEDPGSLKAPARDADTRRYATWLDSRPPAAEVDAIRMMIRLCREYRCDVHIVHVSASAALRDLQAARQEGLPMTAETCPHYLVFESDSIADGATALKCAPPIREHANREQLWDALRRGILGMIASDHSPCSPELRELESGDFTKAWGGIASLEIGLAAVWTEAESRGFGLTDIARWMCEAPARLAGLHGRKGRIEPGLDADLFAWDPQAEQVVDAARLRQRHPVTPYAGMRLRGRVERTWVRGNEVFGADRSVQPWGACCGVRVAGPRARVDR